MEYNPTMLRTRMSLYGLCSFLPSISDEQKRDITELGFAFLLTLRVDKIPSRLARWLVEIFDTCRRAVKLARNDELRISEDDIYLTMGFPRGSKLVQEAKKSDKGDLVDLKEVKDLNWCEFTTDSLISCMDKWKRKPKGAYRGPLLFLMACVQKISRSLKNFARSIIKVVDAVSEA
ncbi:hypothetical protein Cgig2_027292 [Carnegiea gigantea]|uniref:Uncharacterized protein n=1 Tax=Carnegiea gigantea TaxID=171969 RepID=A0A9Q1QB66_9CARY|nr:hypothetical protein Cgig2_027292 [Carnegiea gigantea]